MINMVLLGYAQHTLAILIYGIVLALHCTHRNIISYTWVTAMLWSTFFFPIGHGQQILQLKKSLIKVQSQTRSKATGLVLKHTSWMRRWKWISQQGIPECTREKDECLRILVNCYTWEVDRIWVKIKKGVWEEGRHTVSNIGRVVGIKLTIKDNQRCNIPVVRKRLKTFSRRSKWWEEKLLIPRYLIRLWMDPPRRVLVTSWIRPLCRV